MKNAPSIPLSDTVNMPLIGFGTYLITNEDTVNIVKTAIDLGYRHIDTAQGYHNEEGVGEAIVAAQHDLGIKREDLFITTKLWPGNPSWGEETKGYQGTIDAFHQSLNKLQLKHIDLYLIHAPFDKDNRLAQWRALTDLKEQGLIRAIGVSNFTQSHIDDLLSANLPLPAVNQIELHPWSQKPDLVTYLKNKNIVPMAYSSLVPLSTWRQVDGQDSAKTEKMRQDGEDSASPFKRMALKYGISESQLLLRWGIQSGYPVIPKSTNPERMKQNLDLFDFVIDDQDMKTIENMDRGPGVAWAVGDPSQLV